MKKIFLIIICFCTLIIDINAAERYEVTLNKCVDGDTAWFNLNNKIIKTRFLGIDTPESTTKIEEYGKEASNYTCSKLKSSKKIEIEYDANSDKTDKYNRHLVWVFIDDKLLQSDILKEGLAEVKYIYGDYLYLDQLNEAEEYAKEHKLNIWSNTTDNSIIYEIICFIIIIIIILIFKPNKKTTNKIIKIYKKAMK
ncbi:MAG: thermonuclease family protein [Bacilli bacterium]|nr:thermonuclease family protein [Bacilli bacterium]